MNKGKSKLLDIIQRERAVEFLQSLIQINSVNPKGNELAVAEKIATYTKDAGLQTEIKALTHERANILVHLEGKNPKRPPLIFSGHLDTVPVGDNQWDFNPFSGEIVDGKVFGRGSCDMKGGVAALIEAMIMLKGLDDKPDASIIFAGTAGEEVDCMGAKALIKDGSINNAGAIIIAEPSSGEVFCVHKGALWIEIKLLGKTAHGSMPSQGINAITHMNDLLSKLREYESSHLRKHRLLGGLTLNIGTITGGVKTNVVPDSCTVTIDIRTIPEVKHEEVINDINHILEGLSKEIDNFNAELNIKNDLPALGNLENDEFVQLALDVNHDLFGVAREERGANYYTDGSVFGSSLNVPIIIYGPGDENLAHQPNEYVEIEQFLKSIAYYAELAMKF